MPSSAFVKQLSIATGTALIALGTMGTAQAGTFVDTTSGWGGTYVSWFGEPETATYGQTFTVGTDNFLNNFTFYLKDLTDKADFAAYVMAWDGEKATGPVLYESGPRSTTPGAGFQAFTFKTRNLNLTSGSQYIAFLSSSQFFDGIPGTAGMGHINDEDAYTGGSFVFNNNGSDFSQLTTTRWTAFGDAAFKASFASTAVPEPASVLGLLAVGIVGTGSMLKRKQSNKA